MDVIVIVFRKIEVPFTSSFAAAPVVPSPRFPLVRSRIHSVLFVRNESHTLSSVPTKFVAGSVVEFPDIDHGIAAAPVGVCHVATPVASDIRTLPAPGAPPRIRT